MVGYLIEDLVWINQLLIKYYTKRITQILVDNIIIGHLIIIIISAFMTSWARPASEVTDDTEQDETVAKKRVTATSIIWRCKVLHSQPARSTITSELQRYLAFNRGAMSISSNGEVESLDAIKFWREHGKNFCSVA